MPESFTPREIIDYINSHNIGPRFDPYGSEELSNRLRATQLEKGDIFAEAEQGIEDTKAKIEQAKQDLEGLKNYLAQQQSSILQPEEPIIEQFKAILRLLNTLVVRFNYDTNEAEIVRPDEARYVLDLSDLGLRGELHLPKQLAISQLYCNGNKLRFISGLPDGLKLLWCSENELVELPELPKGLELLHCEDNKLKNLPQLPGTLKLIFCGKNRFTDQAWEALDVEQAKIGFDIEY